MIDGVPVWGDPDEGALQQIRTCSWAGRVVGAALMADHHLGCSMPIGGVVAHEDMVSPSGVGYDMACGNEAVETTLRWRDLEPNLRRVVDQVERTASFGVGSLGTDPELREHPVLDERWDCHPGVRALKERARAQLGSIGAGNHDVDLLVDDATALAWVANHFGSRGFGHGVASGFLNLAAGRPFSSRAPGEGVFQPPPLLDTRTPTGEAYLQAMGLAGDHAHAGRDHVISQVLRILGTTATLTVHNHHDSAWREEHAGVRACVVRKGATPLRPGELAVIGGSMTDVSAVVEGWRASAPARRSRRPRTAPAA